MQQRSTPEPIANPELSWIFPLAGKNSSLNDTLHTFLHSLATLHNRNTIYADDRHAREIIRIDASGQKVMGHRYAERMGYLEQERQSAFLSFTDDSYNVLFDAAQDSARGRAVYDVKAQWSILSSVCSSQQSESTVKSRYASRSATQHAGRIEFEDIAIAPSDVSLATETPAAQFIKSLCPNETHAPVIHR